jgi:hypothetical protein
LYGVFELLMQRNGPKIDKKSKGRNNRKKFFPLNFFVIFFYIDFPQKVLVVF